MIRLFVFLVLLAELRCDRQLYGSKCKNHGVNGICKIAIECPAAVESLMKSRSHDLKRCGFDGANEIVCCPPGDGKQPDIVEPDTKTDPRSPSLTRPCSIACQNFKKKQRLSLKPFIVEGERADEGEFPHMAALGYEHPEEGDIKFDCGGTIISEQHVLTAAHCFNRNNSLVIVRLGTLEAPLSLQRIDPKYDYNVSGHTVHPKYNWKTKVNDIAVVKLKSRVNYNGDTILPACLYEKGDDPGEMIITGWGNTDIIGERSVYLQKASLRSYPLQECNATYIQRTNKQIERTQICAIDDKSDACQGDSGGPLQINSNGSNLYFIVGITSYGIGCGSRYSGVYTRVHSYLSWIEEIVWPMPKNNKITEFSDEIL